MKTQTKETLARMTPEQALASLKQGNQRFVEKKNADRSLLDQVAQTSSEQYPFAVVLGCVDSRVPLELVFDLGIGDIFGVRIAGNIANQDILGSMEFATKVVGSKHILVLGHTSCGAVQGAYDQVDLGNLTGLVNKITPAVEAAGPGADVDEIARLNVELTIEKILEDSPILKGMVDSGEIGISGGMYDVSSGKVTFL